MIPMVKEHMKTVVTTEIKLKLQGDSTSQPSLTRWLRYKNKYHVLPSLLENFLVTIDKS